MNGRFVYDMPNDEYHGLDGVSKSGLDKIARSPAHFKYGKPKDPTRAMEIGTAIHTAILEPERFDKEYVITAAKARTEKEYKDAKAIHGSERTLTAQEGEKVAGMRNSVESDLESMKILALAGKSEVSAICTDPETGVQIRARYDWLTDCGVALDLKKTQDVRPHKFVRSVSDYRYNVQEAFYSYAYKLVTGEELKAFYFLAVEEDAPHSSKLYQLDDLQREIGAYYFRRDLDIFAECYHAGKWPGPDTGDGIIEPSNFDILQYENAIEVII